MGHDVSRLEHQLETLNRRVTELNNVNLTKELLNIIHRPGWTTPAELGLVTNSVEALMHNIDGQIQQSRQLLDAAKRIGTSTKATTAA